MMLKAALLAIVLVAAAGAGEWLRPAGPIDSGHRLALAALVPDAFAGWRLDGNVLVVRPDPDTVRALGELYSDTLERSYINASGYRIMLSIAYGQRQTDTLRAHLPELCYSAQGFEVLEKKPEAVSLGGVAAPLPVMRMLSRNGIRVEPVTYWLNLSGSVVNSQLQRKLVAIAFGMRGAVPDGMLVRISSVDTDIERAYAAQDEFAQQLLHALQPAQRPLLFGLNSGVAQHAAR